MLAVLVTRDGVKRQKQSPSQFLPHSCKNSFFKNFCSIFLSQAFYRSRGIARFKQCSYPFYISTTNLRRFMTNSQKRNHDNFFRTIFADPKNTANLISLAAKNNPNLKELLSLINLETLQEFSGAATREGASGSGDLTFKVEIKNPAKKNFKKNSVAENEKGSNSKSDRPDQLLVGLILEHKSYRDSKIRNQLLKYYFEVMHQKAGNIPAVAIIVYNGRDKWNPLKIKPHPGYPEFFQKVGLPFRVEFIDLGREQVDFSNLDPLLALAIAAMRMVFDAYGAEKYFKTALRRLLKSKQNFRSIVEEILVYFKETQCARS